MFDQNGLVVLLSCRPDRKYRTTYQRPQGEIVRERTPVLTEDWSSQFEDNRTACLSINQHSPADILSTYPHLIGGRTGGRQDNRSEYGD